MCLRHTARRNLIGNRDSYIAFEPARAYFITMLGEKEFGTQLEYRSRTDDAN